MINKDAVQKLLDLRKTYLELKAEWEKEYKFNPLSIDTGGIHISEGEGVKDIANIFGVDYEVKRFDYQGSDSIGEVTTIVEGVPFHSLLS